MLKKLFNILQNILKVYNNFGILRSHKFYRTACLHSKLLMFRGIQILVEEFNGFHATYLILNKIFIFTVALVLGLYFTIKLSSALPVPQMLIFKLGRVDCLVGIVIDFAVKAQIYSVSSEMKSKHRNAVLRNLLQDKWFNRCPDLIFKIGSVNYVDVMSTPLHFCLDQLVSLILL